MLADLSSYQTTVQVNKQYEYYTNYETWIVAYWIRNDPILNIKYKQIIKANVKTQNRQAAMRILINSKADLFILQIGIDFKEVNIDELVIDLCSDYPF